MKTIILACASFIVGILLADIEVLNNYFNENGMHFLTQQIYILPVFFTLILLTVKGIYDITLYTDETLPLKFSILALVMAIVGLLVFYRILLLGMIILIAAAYWNRGIVMSYYPRKRSR